MGKVLDRSSTLSRVRRLVTTTAAISTMLLLGACAQNNALNLGLGNDQTKTVDIATASAGNASQAELEKATAYWGEQHSNNPRDAKAAVSYARNLKAMGRKTNALAVLQSTYMFASEDKELLSEYGRLALDLGQVTTAEKLLVRADDPAKPDWRIVSARGTVLAKQGRIKEAISYFEKALTLSPGQPSLLNNLAMAYTMDGQAGRGEELLRRAAENGPHDPRVQKNLELVMELQGKGVEAQQTASVPERARPQETGIPRAAEPAHPVKNAAWSKPLPIEREAAPVTIAATWSTPPGPNEEDIVQRALEAERAKSANR